MTFIIRQPDCEFYKGMIDMLDPWFMAFFDDHGHRD
jgi:hypothetical protein